MESPDCYLHTETVRACHLNDALGRDQGKGKGIKADDFAIFFGCQGCEDWYTSGYIDDGRAIRDWYAFRAVLRTWRRLLDKGVLK